MKLGPHDLIINLRWHFSQSLKMLLRWRHGGHFVCLWMRHSHGRNFASIFFKIMDKEVWCLPMFAIENQLNRLITSGRKSRPRLQKIVSWFSSQWRRSVVRSPAGTKVLQLDSCYCCDNNWLLLYEKSKWLNILLTPALLLQLRLSISPPAVARPASLPFSLRVPGQGLACGAGCWFP